MSSGQRLVLTYNLAHKSLASNEVMQTSGQEKTQLRELFSRSQDRFTDIGEIKSLAYLFEHQYTDASLRYDTLKEHDRYVVSHLQEVCEEVGFCLCLASLEYTISGECQGRKKRGNKYHHMDGETTSDMSLSRVVDLNGLEVTRDVPFHDEALVQIEPFNGKAPDYEKDFEGNTGSEEALATHWYKRTVFTAAFSDWLVLTL